ncbi:MAG TPA: transporter [Woeseiaceae bacterium]|nr:transporter [Woeseiaceae bacterium]
MTIPNVTNLHRLLLLFLVAVANSLLAHRAVAQELTPRAFWPAPVGTKVLVVSYQHNDGDIVTDPSLPITGVESGINFLQASYQQTFAAFGRTANMQLSLPYSWGKTEGFAFGEERYRKTSGLADMRMQVSINLRGAPAMDGAAFQQYRKNPRTIIGASLLIQAPTGDYASDKLINIGTNRWSAKPAVGLIWPFHPSWMLEAEAGVWVYGDNDEFLGATRKQDPIVSTEVHLIRRIRPGFWMSLDANYYSGGRTSVASVKDEDLQRNSRFGATIVYPFAGHHALRAAYSTGVVTESGGDFEIFSISYIYLWH